MSGSNPAVRCWRSNLSKIKSALKDVKSLFKIECKSPAAPQSGCAKLLYQPSYGGYSISSPLCFCAAAPVNDTSSLSIVIPPVQQTAPSSHCFLLISACLHSFNAVACRMFSFLLLLTRGHSSSDFSEYLITVWIESIPRILNLVWSFTLLDVYTLGYKNEWQQTFNLASIYDACSGVFVCLLLLHQLQRHRLRSLQL